MTVLDPLIIWIWKIKDEFPDDDWLVTPGSKEDLVNLEIHRIEYLVWRRGKDEFCIGNYLGVLLQTKNLEEMKKFILSRFGNKEDEQPFKEFFISLINFIGEYPKITIMFDEEKENRIDFGITKREKDTEITQFYIAKSDGFFVTMTIEDSNNNVVEEFYKGSRIEFRKWFINWLMDEYG